MSERSEICEPLQYKCVKAIPLSGEKSDTEAEQPNRFRGIPFNGEKIGHLCLDEMQVR